mmetsp:Transcript_52716/g.148486  ORF Transcript_52716/g.148486 Transcript_52716/m.148486 type:complete len:207 (+) Transcript_52716:465-1085(+)
MELRDSASALALASAISPCMSRPLQRDTSVGTVRKSEMVGRGDGMGAFTMETPMQTSGMHVALSFCGRMLPSFVSTLFSAALFTLLVAFLAPASSSPADAFRMMQSKRSRCAISQVLWMQKKESSVKPGMLRKDSEADTPPNSEYSMGCPADGPSRARHSPSSHSSSMPEESPVAECSLHFLVWPPTSSVISRTEPSSSRTASATA